MAIHVAAECCCPDSEDAGTAAPQHCSAVARLQRCDTFRLSGAVLPLAHTGTAGQKLLQTAATDADTDTSIRSSGIVQRQLSVQDLSACRLAVHKTHAA